MFKRKIYDKLLEWKRESDGRTAVQIETFSVCPCIWYRSFNCFSN